MQRAPQGYRFVATDRPRHLPVRGTVILAPPFAEEMNKSRRMVAETARALAGDGWRVVRPDLHGCGDSSGDFGDASWSDWVDDLRRSLGDAAGGELWLWGLRAGALLLPPLLAAAPAAKLLLWQPALSGSLVLNQFLRLKTVGALTGPAMAPDRKDLLHRLTRGESIEVAGYRLSPAVAAGLDAARLELPASYRGRVIWLELGADEGPVLSPATSKTVDAWRRLGLSVTAECLGGLQFWQTTEISEVPQLLERTRLLLATQQ